MKAYTIRTGASFRATDAEGQPVTLYGGATIELEDDVASMHADKLDPVAPPAVDLQLGDDSQA